MCSAGVIKIRDELRINKSYSSIVDGKKDSVPVYIGCKITEIINGKLTVILIDYDEEQKEIFSLNMLEEWLLVKFGLDKEYRPKDCHIIFYFLISLPFTFNLDFLITIKRYSKKITS